MAAPKKTPTRKAAGAKAEGAKGSKKTNAAAAKEILRAVVGANVSDDKIDQWWAKLCRHRAEIKRLNEPVKTERAELSNLKKEMKAMGVATRGLDLAYEMMEAAEDAPAIMAWYRRIAKRHGLPQPSDGQLDLLDPTKGAEPGDPAPLVDAETLPGGDKSKIMLDADAFEAGCTAGAAGIHCAPPDGYTPSQIAEFERGWDLSQGKLMANFAKPASDQSTQH